VNEGVVPFLCLAFQTKVLGNTDHIHSLHDGSDRKGGLKAALALGGLGRRKIDDMREKRKTKSFRSLSEVVVDDPCLDLK
jgi:hypothetical protein